MRPASLSISAKSAYSPGGLLLSFSVTLIVMPALFCQQFTGFDSVGWGNGFSHPLQGWDHLLTMLAVGIWAAQLRGQAIWILPLAFVSVMSLGGLAGAAGLSIPSVEGLILLSCAVFCVLITRKIRFNSKINVLIVAFFAFFHGFAHGQEISASTSLISYTLGFMLATLLLHGAGILFAKLVLFSVTCFLTVFISNAAIAAPDIPAVDFETQNAVLTQERGNSETTVFRQQGYIKGQSPCILDLSRPGNDAGTTCGLAGSHGRIADSPPKGPSTIGKVNRDYHTSVFKHASMQLPGKWRIWLCHTCSANYGLLDFWHYFPDINHTQGRDLSSNGVGITSPPVDFLALASHPYFSRFQNTSKHSNQDGNFHIGAPQFKTSTKRRHNCSPYNYRGAAQGSSAAGCNRNAGLLSIISDISNQPGCPDISVLSGFYFQHASQDRFLSAQLAVRSGHALIRPS